MAPSSALPIGMGRTVTETQLVKLDPVNSAGDQAAVLHSVLALIEAPRGGGGPGQADSAIEPPPSDDEITGATVLGFIHMYVQCIRRRLKVLTLHSQRKHRRNAQEDEHSLAEPRAQAAEQDGVARSEFSVPSQRTPAHQLHLQTLDWQDA
jgi:hypothetical protein